MTIILLIMHNSLLATKKAKKSKTRSLQSIVQEIQLKQAVLPPPTPPLLRESAKPRPRSRPRPITRNQRARSNGVIFKSEFNKELMREELPAKTEVFVEQLDEYFYQKYPRLKGKLFNQQEVHKQQPSLTLEQLPFFKQAIQRRKRALSKKAAALLPKTPLLRVNHYPAFNKLFGGRVWKDNHDCQIFKLLRRPLKENQKNDLPWKL